MAGNALANWITGGAGNDTLEGGAGADQFVFGPEPGAGNIDRLSDFVHGIDKLLFEDTIYGTPNFGANVEYDIATGALFYNDIQVAWLGTGTDHPLLTASDIGVT